MQYLAGLPANSGVRKKLEEEAEAKAAEEAAEEADEAAVKEMKVRHTRLAVEGRRVITVGC